MEASSRKRCKRTAAQPRRYLAHSCSPRHCTGGRRRREATDGRLESRAAPAHSCLAPPLSGRRHRWEATDGGPESRGGASAKLPSRAAVQAATGTRGDRRLPQVERWRQYIAALPRRCSGGDRDGRRQTDASSRESAPAHRWMAAPLSSAQPLAAPLYRRRRREEATAGCLESRGGAST